MKQLAKEISIPVLFGMLSIGLGTIQFDMQTVDGGVSDLREIPLIIGIFYLRRGWYVVILAIFSSLATPPEGSMLSTFLMHLTGLTFCWFLFRWQYKHIDNRLHIAMIWLAGFILYYVAFLIPIMIWTNWLAELNKQISFVEFYGKIVESVKFEMATVSIIGALYTVQLNTYKKLKEHLNEISIKNKKIQETAFLHSHILRSPLTKILTSIELLQIEDFRGNQELLTKLKGACIEFDQVIHLIQDVLAEKDLSIDNLEALKEEARRITKKINENH